MEVCVGLGMYSCLRMSGFPRAPRTHLTWPRYSSAYLYSRAEDAGANEAYREQFDVATARAVAEVRTLAELCLPLVKVGGFWVAPKGPEPEEEVHDGLRAIEALGGEARDVRIEEMELSGADDDKPAFTVVTVCKVTPTPAQYPRRANAMKKRPL